VICVSGSLGTMIPPSIVLIIYGLITETSIKALFTASFIPGFMLSAFIIVYIMIRVRIRPEDAPLPPEDPSIPRSPEKQILLLDFLLMLVAGFGAFLFARALFFTAFGMNAVREGVDPIVLGQPGHLPWIGAVTVAAAVLVFLLGADRRRFAWSLGKGLVAPIIVILAVLGSIYMGITGITEAAGMGAIAVFLLALLRGEASVGLVWESLQRTVKATGTIIWVTIGATALAGAYTLAGGPNYVAGLIIGAELPTMGVILAMMVIFLILGAFMDWVGIVLLVIPVFLPIVLKLPPAEIGFFGNLDPRHVAIWYGVAFCMNMQVSFLSPPFGPAAFYLKSVAPPHIQLHDIFRGFLPFMGVQILALTVIVLWPGIVSILL
jgi:TRAP-type mannitol/chloroaromatic compound transport system permease large subunit